MKRILARDHDTLMRVEYLLRTSKTFGFDSESSGPYLVDKKKNSDFINMYRATLTGCSFHFREHGLSYYVPIGHTSGNASPHAVRTLLAVPWRGQARCQNAKHELLAFKGHKDLESCNLVDSAIIMWLLNEWAGDGGYGLKELVEYHYNHKMLTFQEVCRGKQFAERDPADPDVLQYTCEDAEWADQIVEDYLPKLDNYEAMTNTFWQWEMPFVRVLRHIEDTGMVLDFSRVAEVTKKLEEMKLPISKEWDFISDGMNINSSKQLQRFYNEGHWSTAGVEYKKKSGQWSTAGEYMELLVNGGAKSRLGYVAAELRQKHMDVAKLLSTYTGSLVRNAEQYPDSRVHSSLLHWGTATGRLSSSYPNVQNIPVRTELGQHILWCFTAPEGRVMLNADYSQIELRALAHLCGRGALLDAYRDNADVHQRTAELLQISRFQGKTVNFAVVYGAMGPKLAGLLGVSQSEAERILRDFWRTMPEVAELKQKAIDFTRKHGYIRTYLGRIRRLDNISSGNKWLRLKDERRAGNTPIQGFARDLITMAMVNIYNRLRKEDLLSDIQMSGQVHDDLLLYSTKEAKDYAKSILKEEMESVAKLRVPLIAEPGEGTCWKDLKC